MTVAATSTTSSSYRSVLKGELERRCKRNPRYSLRAFAKDLGISAGNLFGVLNAKCGLSQASAYSISSKLGFNTEECEHFCNLVKSECARDVSTREQAKKSVDQRNSFQQISTDSFAVISDWYHFALLELMSLKNYESDTLWMSRRLNVDESSIEAALMRMERLGLVERQGDSIRPTGNFTSTPTDVPSDAIRKFHKQILEKALAAVQTQEIQERDYSGMILSVNRSDLPAAKESIRHFRRGFDERFGGVGDKDSVYCLGVQFFRLDERMS